MNEVNALGGDICMNDGGIQHESKSHCRMSWTYVRVVPTAVKCAVCGRPSHRTSCSRDLLVQVTFGNQQSGRSGERQNRPTFFEKSA